MAMLNAKERVQLLDLNDDILETILINLNIFPQFLMGKLHPRFYNIVQRLWSKSASRVFLSENMFCYGYRKASDREFLEFVWELVEHMRHLVWGTLYERKIELLCMQRFELITCFEWVGEIQRGNGIPNSDEEYLLKLHYVFPKLRSLKIRCRPVTGEYLNHFPFLRSLYLVDCQYPHYTPFGDAHVGIPRKRFFMTGDAPLFKCCDFAEIKECQALEDIEIADNHVCVDSHNFDKILRMPNLHNLSFYCKNSLLDVMKHMTHNTIATIVAVKFSGYCYDYAKFFHQIGHMKCLQRLSMNCCIIQSSINNITDDMLLRVAQKLPKLEEIHFNSFCMQSYVGITHFVRYCENLRLINVTYSKSIGNDLIWSSIELLQKQTLRTTPLEIWIYKSDIDRDIEENPRYKLDSAKLKINKEFVSPNTNVSDVRIEFTFPRD